MVVVEIVESLRDEIIGSAKIFQTAKDGLEYINKINRRHGQYSFAMFELGKEIRLKTTTKEIPQEPIKKTFYVI